MIETAKEAVEIARDITVLRENDLRKISALGRTSENAMAIYKDLFDKPTITGKNALKRTPKMAGGNKSEFVEEKSKMKTIGLIGGMSWESTVTYYQIINNTIKEEMGGLHSAKIILYSVDFAEIEECQANGDWEKSADILSEAAHNLENAGADFIVICTNTMHKVVPQIQKKISIPIVHIADATAEELEKNNIKKVALLGTKYTMTQDFYKERIKRRGIDVIIPDKVDVELVNRVIYDELCLGNVRDESRKQYIRIIEQLKNEGAEGVILGCTEIGLLIKQVDASLPVFDTTQIHAYVSALKSIK